MPQELMEKKVDDQKASEDKRWMKSYKLSLYRCKFGHYGERGIKFTMTKEDFKALWIRDKGHLLKRPSIDRINTADGYHFYNCRFIELSDNVNRPVSRNDGLLVQNLSRDGKVINTFISANYAARRIGVNKKSILWCINGRQSTCAGFRWRTVAPTAKLIKHVGDDMREADKALDAIKQSIRVDNPDVVEVPSDIKEFIRTITLDLQSIASKSEQQKTEMFNRAYRLYAKYDLEGKHSLGKQ